ncbi:hypothetical protein LBMAG38_08940 [Chloroflexota bacterium]|nr:hypothetical protein LBMAG38_08940 [Chloroflexota bacterium]
MRFKTVCHKAASGTQYLKYARVGITVQGEIEADQRPCVQARCNRTGHNDLSRIDSGPTQPGNGLKPSGMPPSNLSYKYRLNVATLSRYKWLRIVAYIGRWPPTDTRAICGWHPVRMMGSVSTQDEIKLFLVNV